MTKNEISKALEEGKIVEGEKFLFKLDSKGNLIYKLKDSSTDEWRSSCVEFNYPESFRIYQPPKKRATNSFKGQAAADAIINGTYF